MKRSIIQGPTEISRSFSYEMALFEVYNPRVLCATRGSWRPPEAPHHFEGHHFSGSSSYCVEAYIAALLARTGQRIGMC